MTDSSKFKVLLYSDGTNQAFSAAVYAASLLKNMPTMDLTIVQVQESEERFMGTEYSWKELRPKYKRFYWGRTRGEEYCWIKGWPVSPNEDWLKRIFNESEMETKDLYIETLTKTHEILSMRGHNVRHQLLCSNVKISDTSDTGAMILDYAVKNMFGLIIMGERECSTLSWIGNGSLEYSVRNNSSIPVVLVKKLSQKFIDRYLLDTAKFNLISSEVTEGTNGSSINILF